MRGRRPKPTALKVFEGNPGHRRLNEAEPSPTSPIPECPKFLDAIAREEWKRIAAELGGLGLLTGIDRAAMASYCQWWSRWQQAETALQDKGIIIKSASGTPVSNPWLSVANQASQQMKAFAVELGLTPSARSRVHVKPTSAPQGPRARVQK